MLWFEQLSTGTHITVDIVHRVLTVTLVLWFNRVKYWHMHYC